MVASSSTCARPHSTDPTNNADAYLAFYYLKDSHPIPSTPTCAHASGCVRPPLGPWHRRYPGLPSPASTAWRYCGRSRYVALGCCSCCSHEEQGEGHAVALLAPPAWQKQRQAVAAVAAAMLHRAQHNTPVQLSVAAIPTARVLRRLSPLPPRLPQRHQMLAAAAAATTPCRCLRPPLPLLSSLLSFCRTAQRVLKQAELRQALGIPQHSLPPLLLVAV